MKTYRGLIKKFKSEKGVAAIFVVIGIVVLLGIAAYAIDIGYGFVAKNQLQNISDGASLAGTSRLWKIYKDNPTQSTVNVSDIMDYINHIKDNNTAAGTNIALNSGDVKIGKWDFGSNNFIETTQHPTAVRVIASRNANTGHLPLETTFARVLGINNMNIETDSIATLTGKCEGHSPIPIGISEHRFSTEYCNQPIKFLPANDPASCGGWNTYTNSPSSASKLIKILEGLAADPPTFTIPDTKANETSYNFVGGALTSVFDAFEILFNKMKIINDHEKSLDDDPNTVPIDDDEDSSTWTTFVPVYYGEDCSNPNQTRLIVGFAKITIFEVIRVPEKTITATIVCDTDPGQGGACSPFGLLEEHAYLVE